MKHYRWPFRHLLSFFTLVVGFATALVGPGRAAETFELPAPPDPFVGLAATAPRSPDLYPRSSTKLTLGLDTALRQRQSSKVATGNKGVRGLAMAAPRRRSEEQEMSFLIDAVASTAAHQLEIELMRIGASVIDTRGRVVSARMTEPQLEALEDLQSLAFAKPAMAATQTGLVTTQGDPAQRSDLARINSSVSGAGTVIGVLSDSFDCSGVGSFNMDVSTGDLPSDLMILDDSACPASDEGRAMAQILYDIAPGAEILFHTAFNGQADFAQGILDLAQAGAQVIVDDVVYFAEPFFQDGVIAQAVDEVNRQGVAYFSSAGNSGRQAYSSEFAVAETQGSFGRVFHDFDPGDSTDIRLLLDQGRETIYVLQWQDPFFSVSGSPGASTDLDICFYSPPGEDQAFWCASDDNLGRDPIEVTRLVGAGPLEISIELIAGPRPRWMKLIMFGDMDFLETYRGTHAGTIAGHANSRHANAVGAAAYFLTPAFGLDEPLLNDFSSAGNTPILFDLEGSPIFDVREKPEFTAPDGGNNTFFGFDIEPDGLPNFFGTSASAPHAAGVAALMRECNPAMTPEALTAAMKRTSIDILDRQSGVPIDVGWDSDSGAGLIDAESALRAACDNGDLMARIGVYRPSQGQFRLDLNGDPATADWVSSTMGGESFFPVTGDWVGDGESRLGLYNQTTGYFFLDLNGNGRWDGTEVDRTIAFGGGAGFLPVVGDWNADGRTELGVYHEQSGTWFLDANADDSWGTGQDISFVFGCAQCRPVSGDWQGVGQSHPGYYDPRSGDLVLGESTRGAAGGPREFEIVNVGGGWSFTPVSGDWNGDGIDDLGLFNEQTGVFYLDWDGNRQWAPELDKILPFGLSGDRPLAGAWPLSPTE